MDGIAYHSLGGGRGSLGIVHACIILVDGNLRGYTNAWRRDVRYGTHLETIRFQTCIDAPEGYPRGRTGAVHRHALRGMVSVPTAQPAL